MTTSGVKVLLIGHAFDLPHVTRHVSDSAQIMPAIAAFAPDVIVSSGFIPGALDRAGFEIRKRWLHVEADASPENICALVESCYAFNLWQRHPHQSTHPLISVFTGTFNSGSFLCEAYQSLVDQHYPNWEWVVVDDHSGDGTWERLLDIARDDCRVRPFRSGVRLAKIGAVKDAATRLARGEYVVELDHDDMLTDDALTEIQQAFASHADVGMVYSNSASFFENGSPQRFDDDFWRDRYRETEYRGRRWLECLQPDIHDRFGPAFHQQFGWFLTVGPHHVRAFRTSTLIALGGYNPNLPVADDWDLFARFFLRSRCLLIPKLLYLYRYKDNAANTTFRSNAAIQDHLMLGRQHYAAEFDAFNRKRLAAEEDVAERPAFVIATRTEADATALRAGLGGYDVFISVGASSILDAYEQGRLHWRGRRRIVYLHDDVDVIDIDRFAGVIATLPSGLHGPCGSAAVDALDRGPWWLSPPLVGAYVQVFDNGAPVRVVVHEPAAVDCTWLDGFCLIAIDQSWSWCVPDGGPIWHGYDWLACMRTLRAGGACRTLPQETGPLLAHRGYLRMEGFEDALLKLQQLTHIERAQPVDTVAAISFVVLEAVVSDLTLRCLTSIRQFAATAEIVLVANGCAPSDAAIALVDHVVQLDTNLGFSAGCSAGAAQASRTLVCFLNNDAAFVDDTPRRLAAAINARHLIVAPFSNRAKPPQGDVERVQTPTNDLHPDMVVGLCMMMPLALYRELGGFDPRLLTWEDDDFCARARRRGAHCKVVGGCWVEHERSATFAALGLDMHAVMARNRQLFESMHPRIRVIVIARDEAATVVEFFEQFAGLTRDWALLDTGSSDATVELARSIGVRVESTAFVDFASARNAALDRFAEGADWILMLDLDERLDADTIARIPELTFATSCDILLAPLVAVYADGTRREFVAKPFLFRAGAALRWIFKVHEKLIGSTQQALVRNARIDHLIAVHAARRREAAEERYARLMAAEPYFSDSEYRQQMRERWPILDYDRSEDTRMAKIFSGPLITVVIPTWRRPELLKRAIASVLMQDYVNIDVVVIGDACPQLDIGEIAMHPHIRCYNLAHNHGAGGAVPRNHGIQAAAGALIAYLDDDNLWARDHLSSLWQAMSASGAHFAFSSMQVDGRDIVFAEPAPGGIDTSCLLHRRELIEVHGGWKDRIDGGYAHDWELVSRWLRGGASWVATQRPTLIYNAETSGQADFIRTIV